MDIMELIQFFLNPTILMLIGLGIMMGIIFGCIPGLNTAMALALALPMTYEMDMITAISFLLAVYCGGLSGGSISAILLNIPGTAAAVTTTFDGYPMAQKGQSMRALSLSIISAFFGGIIAAIILAFLTGSLANFALSFGSWEYFGTALFSLVLISTLVDGSKIKATMATGMGVLLSTIGTDPILSTSRFTFGFFELNAGVNIVVVIIGVFALSEIVCTANCSLKRQHEISGDFSIKEFGKAFKEVASCKLSVVVSSILGTVMGILPGLGGGTAGVIAYSVAKGTSKHSEEFGTGSHEGIIAPEAAKNAVSGGAMIPAIALGVPGSSPVALIMSAFLVHGVTIGPMIITEQPHILHSIFIALIVANILMLVLQGGMIKYFAKIVTVPKSILFPIIAVFCVVGAYIVNTSTFNIFIMLVLVVIGMITSKNGFPPACIVMGFVLGTTVESFYRKSMITFKGSFINAITTPSVGSVFVILSIIVPIVIITIESIKKKKAKAI